MAISVAPDFVPHFLILAEISYRYREAKVLSRQRDRAVIPSRKAHRRSIITINYHLQDKG